MNALPCWLLYHTVMTLMIYLLEQSRPENLLLVFKFANMYIILTVLALCSLYYLWETDMHAQIKSYYKQNTISNMHSWGNGNQFTELDQNGFLINSTSQRGLNPVFRWNELHGLVMWSSHSLSCCCCYCYILSFLQASSGWVTTCII